MNIVQAEHISNNTGKAYIYKVPGDCYIAKGALMLAENNRTGKSDVVIAVSESEDVSKNVLNMIMQGKEVISSIIGVYWLMEIGNVEGKDE